MGEVGWRGEGSYFDMLPRAVREGESVLRVVAVDEVLHHACAGTGRQGQQVPTPQEGESKAESRLISIASALQGAQKTVVPPGKIRKRGKPTPALKNPDLLA